MEIVVLGGGPAGVACASGLSRMGYCVRLISAPRRFDSFEGISQRVHQALRNTGLQRAAASILNPKVRQVYWGSNPSQLNSESIIERQSFDAALLEDAASHGVCVFHGRVTKVLAASHGYVVTCEADGIEKKFNASFLVEARGRQASFGKNKISGPGSLSLLGYWEAEADFCPSMIESIRHGWIWATTVGVGRVYTQLSIDASANAVKDLIDPAAYLQFLQAESAVFAKYSPVAMSSVRPVYARGSTAMCSLETGGANWLRVGDAAMAVDPLSGNGIFQALSTSLQAPAVINTLIKRPQQSKLALDFHHKRVQHLFKRFARVGRDFYRIGKANYPRVEYWERRADWPDNVQLNTPISFDSLRIVDAGVNDHGLIKRARVVTSPEQPLGMWHLAGLELAPRVQRLFQGEGVNSVVADLGFDESARFRSWLRSQGYAGN